LKVAFGSEEKEEEDFWKGLHTRKLPHTEQNPENAPPLISKEAAALIQNDAQDFSPVLH
jgi:hypothetical protein